MEYTLADIALIIWSLIVVAGMVWLFLPGTGLGPEWSPERTNGGWTMLRKIDGKIESRPATEAEGAEAQAQYDYEWWAIR